MLADALSSAGHTILVSGVTLIIACVGLLIIPMDAVGALGVGCAVAVASVLASNLTLVPAVMLSCPDFFRGVVDRVVRDETTLLLVNDTPTREKRRALCACCPSWERFAERLVDTKVSALVVLLIVAVTAPFAYPAVTFATSQSVIMALPRGAPVTDAFLEMSREFGYGLLNTYDLLVHASANESVLTESFFEKSASAMRLLAERLPNTSIDSFSGISLAGGTDIPLVFTQACLNSASPLYGTPDCLAVRAQFESTVNEARTAALFTVMLNDFDPNSASGLEWYKRFLDIRADVERNTSLSLGLTSGPAPGFDGVILAVSFFPTMIGITGAAIFVVMGIALKSVLMPIRALFAVGLTLVFSYGSAALVYEWGVLNWLGVGSLHTVAGDRSLLWMPPLVSFCMLCGLCLDYELFLVLRIAHYRRVIGLSHRSAIVQGLSSTGPVVTAAGCIMAVAFCSNLFSATMALNQLSFYLVTAVLYDTFIVRTLLVPCMMSLLGDVVWWPAKLPPTSSTTLKD